MYPWQYYQIYESLTFLVEAGAINKKQLKENLSKVGLTLELDKSEQEVWTDGRSKYYMSRPLSEVSGCCGEGCCNHKDAVGDPDVYSKNYYTGC